MNIVDSRRRQTEIRDLLMTFGNLLYPQWLESGKSQDGTLIGEKNTVLRAGINHGGNVYAARRRGIATSLRKR